VVLRPRTLLKKGKSKLEHSAKIFSSRVDYGRPRPLSGVGGGAKSEEFSSSSGPLTRKCILHEPSLTAPIEASRGRDRAHYNAF